MGEVPGVGWISPALTALSWSGHSPSSSWLRENRSSSCVAMATTFSWWAPSSSRHCVILPAVKEHKHRHMHTHTAGLLANGAGYRACTVS